MQYINEVCRTYFLAYDTLILHVNYTVHCKLQMSELYKLKSIILSRSYMLTFCFRKFYFI